MNKIEPRTLSGFMELLPEEQILFDQMKEVIENTYKNKKPVDKINRFFVLLTIFKISYQ